MICAESCAVGWSGFWFSGFLFFWNNKKINKNSALKVFCEVGTSIAIGYVPRKELKPGGWDAPTFPSNLTVTNLMVTALAENSRADFWNYTR